MNDTEKIIMQQEVKEYFKEINEEIEQIIEEAENLFSANHTMEPMLERVSIALTRLTEAKDMFIESKKAEKEFDNKINYYEDYIKNYFESKVDILKRIQTRGQNQAIFAQMRNRNQTANVFQSRLQLIAQRQMAQRSERNQVEKSQKPIAEER